MISLAIAAFRRPYYLQRQLDAWLRVRGAEQIDLCCVTLGWSDRYMEQQDVLLRFTEQAPFPVVWKVDDPPAGHNVGIGRAVQMAFDAGAGFTFFMDEDILPADDLLEYVTWAQEKYAADQQVLVVNAHSEGGQGWDGPYVRDDPYGAPEIVRLKRYFNMWGWGTWADRWQRLILPEWDWAGQHRGCDWNLQRLVTEHDLRGITPDASRTQHIGYRDGIFASAATLAFSEAASFREHREPAGYREEPPR